MKLLTKKHFQFLFSNFYILLTCNGCYYIGYGYYAIVGYGRDRGLNRVS